MNRMNRMAESGSGRLSFNPVYPVYPVKASLPGISNARTKPWGSDTMRITCLAAMLVLTSAAAGAAQPAAPPKVKAIVGGTVVNLDGGTAIDNAVVLIEGEKIKSIGPAGTEVPAGAEVIRAAGTWLIPGLTNMHVHFGLKLPGRDRSALAEETTAALTLRMMINARDSLYAGITTVRMTGSEGNTGIAVRDAIARGEYDGPRVYTAGGVTMTGGHGSRPGQTYNDGPYEMVKTARMKIREGQDWIKIAISGGVATDGDGGITEALMTPEEMRAIIDIQLRGLMKRLEDRKIRVELAGRAKDLLIAEGYDPMYGARPLKRVIQRRVLDPLAVRVLEGEFREGDVIRIDAPRGELEFVKAEQPVPA